MQHGSPSGLEMGKLGMFLVFLVEWRPVTANANISTFTTFFFFFLQYFANISGVSTHIFLLHKLVIQSRWMSKYIYMGFKTFSIKIVARIFFIFAGNVGCC